MRQNKFNMTKLAIGRRYQLLTVRPTLNVENLRFQKDIRLGYLFFAF